jgi:CRISPR/Cas system-associated protein Cas10 (large subunit of type III CRISPR-Cas system)
VAKNNNNQVQDFETLASEDYLAYIKGDVDNMSLILGYGFDDDQTGIHNQYSVSRIVSFARLLEYFFGYRTHAFLEKNFAQTSYTVFS